MANRFSVEAIFKAIDKVSAPVSAMQNSVSKMTRSIEAGLRGIGHRVDRISGKFAGLAKTAVVGAGAFATIAAGGIAYLVSQYSKIEDAEAAFTPLMGGAERARLLIEELNKAAAETPFEFEDISSATKQLLPVMNGDIQKTVDTLKMLGDTAGGNAQKLDSITRGFTKAMLKGKVDMESLNMIAEAGVPIFSELAKSMGVKVNAAFFKMISTGKVSTAQLSAAFQKMTSEGGVFYKGMEIASRTTSGLLSTLSDNVSLAAADIGKELAPTVKDLIKYAIDITQKVRDWVASNKELIQTKVTEFAKNAKDAIEKLVAKIQAMNKEYSLLDRAIDIMTGLGKAIAFLVQYGEPIAKFVAVLVVLIAILKIFTVVMTAVNIVLALNPIVLIVMAVIALIAAMAVLIVYSKEVYNWFVKLPLIAKALLGPLGIVIFIITKSVNLIKEGIDYISKNWDKITGFFGFGGGEQTAQQGAAGAQVVSPQARTATAISETNTTTTSEVTIKDQTGRAEVTKGSMGPNLQLVNSGNF